MGAKREDLSNDFTHHPPFGDQVERYQSIREAGKQFAEIILTQCPISAEATLAYRQVQEAVMWANASIAINENNPVGKAKE